MPAKEVAVFGSYKFINEPQYSYTIKAFGGRACSDSEGKHPITGAEYGDDIYLFPDELEPGVEYIGWTDTHDTYTDSHFTMPSNNVQYYILTKDHRVLDISMHAEYGTPSLGKSVSETTCTLSAGTAKVTGVWEYEEEPGCWRDYNGTTFEVGKYRYRAELTPKNSDECFTRDTILNVDGESHRMYLGGANGDGTYSIAYVYSAEYEVATRAIHEVVVSGFEKPVADKYAGMYGNLRVVSEGCKIDGRVYFKDELSFWVSSGKMMKITDTFEAEETYFQGLFLTTEPEYYFAEDCVFKTDDKGFKVDEELSVVSDKTSAQIIGEKLLCEVPGVQYYPISVTGGIARNSGLKETVGAKKGDKLYLYVNTLPEGKEFERWIVLSGNVTLDDPTSTQASFTMPAGKVIIKARYVGDPAERRVYFRGDVDGNGKVESKDYIKLKRYVLQTYKTTDRDELERMNVDQKNGVDSKDYIMLKRVVLKTYSFPEDIAYYPI